jgi:heptosyltransferase-3
MEGRMKREIQSALVVCTRRIGDVLLATPVVRSIKAAYPEAAVDILVFEGTQDVVSANPDIRRVWTIAERAPIGAQLRMLRSLWRRYDVAVSVFGGDRPIFYTCIAGRYRIGALGPYNNSWWKRRLLNVWVPFDRLGTHTVSMNLRLLEPLGIEPRPTPVVGWTRADEESVERLFRGASNGQRYAVLHVSPKFAYKMWTPAGWASLGRWLVNQGLSVVVTGGAEQNERTYCEDVARQLPVGTVNLAGQMGLPALAYLLSRASLYVGTDTAVSHMAAAVGTPMVVLFGPSNPVKWGPWPKDFPSNGPSPWKTKGSQRVGNVWLLQGEGDCVPCLAEGCERHVNSMSDCLQHLPANRVIQAAEQMLAFREDRRGLSAVL